MKKPLKRPYEFKLYKGQTMTFEPSRSATRLEDLSRSAPQTVLEQDRAARTKLNKPLKALHCWLCKASFLHKNPAKKYCSLRCHSDIMAIRADLLVGKPFPEEIL